MPVVILGGDVGSNVTPITGGGANAAIDGTTGVVIPSWTYAGRPSNPVKGQQGWNTSNNVYEIYTGTGYSAGWKNLTGSY